MRCANSGARPGPSSLTVSSSLPCASRRAHTAISPAWAYFTALSTRLDRAIRTRVGSDRKSTRLNSSHLVISYAVFCLKKKKINYDETKLMKRKIYTKDYEYIPNELMN